MIKYTLKAISLFTCFAAVHAADNQALEAFARTNADRFFNELKTTKGIALDSKVTVNVHFDDHQIGATSEGYDPVAGILRTSLSRLLSNVAVKDSCTATGSYMGQNGYGAKTLVRQKTCERISIEHSQGRGVDIGGATLTLTPNQYRTLTSRGVKAQIDISVGTPQVRQPVVFGAGYGAPTIDDPSELRIRNLTVFGTFQEVRIQVPGSDTFSVLWNGEAEAKETAAFMAEDTQKQKAFYDQLVRSCIRPGVIYTASDALRNDDPVATFQVALTKNSEQAAPPQLLTSSGVASFDRAVENGIRRCDPFPRQPSGRSEAAVVVRYKMFD